MPGRERSPDELAEDLDEIKVTLRDLRDDLRTGYVPRELYDARHTALRSEIALEFASMKAQHESTHRLAMWAMALVCGMVITVLGGLLVTITGGAA